MLPHGFTHFDSLPTVPLQICPRGVPSQPAASPTFPPPPPPSTLTRTPHIPKLGLPAQIAGLSIKSGNGVLLKCGREAVNSCKAIVDAIKDGLKMSKASPGTCALPHMQPHISHRKAQDYFTGKHALVHVRCRSLTPPPFPLRLRRPSDIARGDGRVDEDEVIHRSHHPPRIERVRPVCDAGY